VARRPLGWDGAHGLEPSLCVREVAGIVTGLDAQGWLPGTSTLIATGEAENYGDGPYTTGTYAVAADGTASELTSADLGWVSLVHY
jgi:hypothetical protein